MAVTPNGAMASAIANSSLTAGSIQEAAGILAKQSNSKHVEDLVAHVLQIVGHARREPQRLSKTYARLLGDLFIEPLVRAGRHAREHTPLLSWDADTVAGMNALNAGQLPGDIVTAAQDLVRIRS